MGSIHGGEGSDGSLKHRVVECANPPLQVKPLISLAWVSTIEPSRFWTLTKDKVVEGRRRRRVSDLATFATFHPGWFRWDRILAEKTTDVEHHCTMKIAVSPVENAVQDKADDDNPTIQPGNGNRVCIKRANKR